MKKSRPRPQRGWMPHLLAWVCDEIERHPPKWTIEALAAADDERDFDANLAAIRRVLAGDRGVLRPFDYPLREACALSRYHRPKPGQVYDNLVSLFAVLLIAIAEFDPKNTVQSGLDELEDSLISIVEHVTSIFPERAPDALALLDYLAAFRVDEESFGQPTLALARFLLLEAEDAAPEAMLAALTVAATWAERHGSDEERRRAAPARYRWMLWATLGIFDKDRWRTQLDGAAARLRDRHPEVAEALDALATRSE